MAKKDESTTPRESGSRDSEGETPAGFPRQDFRSAVRALLSRQRPAQGSHPDPAQLRDYRRRRLPVRLAVELREHLSLCRRCCRHLLALAGLPDVRQVAPPLGRRRRRE